MTCAKLMKRLSRKELQKLKEQADKLLEQIREIRHRPIFCPLDPTFDEAGYAFALINKFRDARKQECRRERLLDMYLLERVVWPHPTVYLIAWDYHRNMDLDVSEIEQELISLVRSVAERLPWLEYARHVVLFREVALAAFIASPPSGVLLKRLKPTSYFANHFIVVKFRTGKRHRTVISKFFFTECRNLISITDTIDHRQVVAVLKDAVGSDLLIRKFQQNREKYIAAGKKPGLATKLAYRDVLRICVGNVYLVYTWLAIEKGYIEPSPALLPYEAAQNPNLVDYIDPVYTVKREELPEVRRVLPKIEEIKWSKFIKMCIEGKK